MVDQHPEDAIVLDALRGLGASGARIDSGDLRRACGLSAARVRESVQRLRWKGKVAMDRLEIAGSAIRWARPSAAAPEPDFGTRNTLLRAGLLAGLAALERQRDVVFDVAPVESKIALVRRALAVVTLGADTVVLDQAPEPSAAAAIEPAPVVATPNVCAPVVPVLASPPPASPAPPVRVAAPVSSPKPAPRSGQIGWVEAYVARVRDARDYLDRRGFAVVRASETRSTWKVAGWSGEFDNDQLVAFADDVRARSQA